MTVGMKKTRDDVYLGQGCRYNHEHNNEEGKTLRIRAYGCLLCHEKFAGCKTFVDVYNRVDELNAMRKKYTPEESRRKQIEHSRNWTKRNAEKQRAYCKKYRDSFPPEEKKARHVSQYQRAKAKKLLKEQQDGYKGQESKRQGIHERDQGLDSSSIS